MRSLEPQMNTDEHRFSFGLPQERISGKSSTPIPRIQNFQSIPSVFICVHLWFHPPPRRVHLDSVQPLCDSSTVNAFETEARAAVGRAAEHLIAAHEGHVGGREKVEFKGEVDLVTATDRELERILVEHITDAFPDHAVVAEEGTAAKVAAASAEYVWYIDPLDGTTNFAHAYPHFAISVGLAHRGETVF